MHQGATTPESHMHKTVKPLTIENQPTPDTNKHSPICIKSLMKYSKIIPTEQCWLIDTCDRMPMDCEGSQTHVSESAT